MIDASIWTIATGVMRQRDLKFFRRLLEGRKREILEEADRALGSMNEKPGEAYADPTDRATLESDRALLLRMRDRERKLLKKVQQSLARIDSGDYGWCEETGEPIGVPRLLARPTATLSLEAQERRELRQKLFGD